MEKKKSFTLGTREANDALKEIRKSLPSGKFSSQSLGAAAVGNEKITDEKFAELVVKSTMGEDVFRRDTGKAVKKEHKDAIDYQIDKLRYELKNIEKIFKIVEKKGANEQIKEHRERIEFLKGEIKKAEEVKKAEQGKKIESEGQKKQKIEGGGDVFGKRTGKIEKKEIKKKVKDDNELDKLGEELVFLKNKKKKTKDAEEKNELQNKINLIIEKREQLKLQRDELKEKIKAEENRKSEEIEIKLFGKTSTGYEITDEKLKKLLESTKEEVREAKAKKEIELTDNQQTEIEQKLGEFNIKQEDVEKIDGFKELSYGQRLLVLENLKQLILDKIKEEALIRYEEDTDESKILGKIWNYTTKKYQIAKWEKLIAENLKRGGIDVHGGDLERLVKGVKDTERFLLATLKERRAQSEKDEQIKVEKKLTEDAVKIEPEIEKMPEGEKKNIWHGLLNLGFYATKLKSDAMAWICDKAVIGSEKSIQEQGTIKRFLASMAETYKKDSEKASKQIESPTSFIGIKSASSTGQIIGGFLKYGRTVADIAGWTAGSPLRYVMAGAQFFSRGAEAIKEARLKNKDVIEKTRADEKNIKEIEEAAEQAWKIYKMAEVKAGEGNVTKEFLEKSYVENLPQDLLERLKKSEPGTATGILQRVLKKDLELAIKYGRVNETRLKEYDRIISKYGEVDALAIGAKYAETAGKAVIAGVQIETAMLLMQRLPEIMEKLSLISGLGGVKSSEGPHFEEILKLKQEISEIAQKSELENTQAHLAEIATIKQGEGIEHALIRQLNDNPKKFGFTGNIENKTDIKMWANNEAHKITIKNNYINTKTGKETWIRESKEKPSLVILQDDKTIKFENANLYKYLSSVKSGISTEIPIGNDKKVFDIFDQQTRPEKWRTIQIYQNSIDSMKANLDKFPDPQVKASIQAEIDRLNKVEQSLIYRLSEQTPQATETTQIAGAKAAEAVSQISLEAEKINILDNLIYKNSLSSDKADSLINLVNNKKIMPEDFGNYYANKLGVEKLSDESMNNLKNNFKIINKGPQSGKAQEYLMAKKAIQILIQKIEKK